MFQQMLTADFSGWCLTITAVPRSAQDCFDDRLADRPSDRIEAKSDGTTDTRLHKGLR